MTRAVWMWTVVVAVVLAAGWETGVSGSQATRLRSEHSQPAHDAPSVVAVTEHGKLFHRPDCTFIHGPSQLEPGERAIAQGYSPCTRCMRRRVRTNLGDPGQADQTPPAQKRE